MKDSKGVEIKPGQRALLHDPATSAAHGGWMGRIIDRYTGLWFLYATGGERIKITSAVAMNIEVIT